MFAISGVTGHVGGAAARELLAQGQPVRAIVRDRAKGAPWAALGADVAVASLDDPAALAAALAGATGFFALVPNDPSSRDPLGDARRITDAIASAVERSRVPHVVLLSSLGAELSEGTGPIVGLHQLETKVRATGAVVTSLRPTFFQESVGEVIGAARHMGIYPSFLPSADMAASMVATLDIGRAVAGCLASQPASSEVVDVLGPEYSSRQIASALGAALGKTLQIVDVPPAGWVPAMMEGGMSREVAELLAEMYAAVGRGAVLPCGDRLVVGETGIEETIARLVG
jgi:uncharacterized protein YbjT (DUF2867 family)